LFVVSDFFFDLTATLTVRTRQAVIYSLYRVTDTGWHATRAEQPQKRGTHK